jgi:hypothetical protein
MSSNPQSKTIHIRAVVDLDFHCDIDERAEDYAAMVASVVESILDGGSNITFAEPERDNLLCGGVHAFERSG